MQPTYLPWCGYISMLDRADIFVLLDTVSFSRQSWQQRNRVRLVDSREVWLTVPAHAHLTTRLVDVEIAGTGWRRKHLATIEAAYKSAPHWPDLRDTLAPIYAQNWLRLASFNEALIRALADHLGIRTPITRASELGSTRAGRIERLQDLLVLAEADTLLEPRSGDYLADGAPFHVEWSDYEHPVYSQGNQKFASHLSVIDLIAWHGPEALDILRRGYSRSDAEALQQVRISPGA